MDREYRDVVESAKKRFKQVRGEKERNPLEPVYNFTRADGSNYELGPVDSRQGKRNVVLSEATAQVKQQSHELKKYFEERNKSSIQTASL